MYPEALVKPMKAELTSVGFEELLTPILSLINGINDIASKDSEEAKADQSPKLSPRKKGRKKNYDDFLEKTDLFKFIENTLN